MLSLYYKKHIFRKKLVEISIKRAAKYKINVTGILVNKKVEQATIRTAGYNEYVSIVLEVQRSFLDKFKK